MSNRTYETPIHGRIPAPYYQCHRCLFFLPKKNLYQKRYWRNPFSINRPTITTTITIRRLTRTQVIKLYPSSYWNAESIVISRFLGRLCFEFYFFRHPFIFKRYLPLLALVRICDLALCVCVSMWIKSIRCTSALESILIFLIHPFCLSVTLL